MAHQTLAPALERVGNEARSSARQASPGLVWLGRLGFTCKGVVYILIGVLAARAAIGDSGGDTIDTQGALQRVLQAPFGALLLGIVAVGLAGYAVWRVVQAILDIEHKGTDLEGLWARGGYLASASIHVLLTLGAVQLLLGRSDNGGGEASAQDRTARLLEQPFGPWLVALVGLAVLWTAAFQGYRAYTTNFQEKLRVAEMGSRGRRVAIWAGRLGYAARAVTFGIMGLFLLIAAFRQAPSEAKGIGGALDTVAQQPYGPLLLTVVAAGLVAYGLYMFVEARFRRML